MSHTIVQSYAINRAYHARGARVLVPVFPAWRRGYRVVNDAMETGWWWFAVGLAAERLGPHLHGVALRITWGWVRK